MRLLVFEYITGGGFNNQSLPASLLQEAYLMRNALLDDISAISKIELLILQDERVEKNSSINCLNPTYLLVSQEDNLAQLLEAKRPAYDAVWLIAPETDGVLAKWCQFFAQQGKELATCAQQAVEICQDKYATTKRLQQEFIPVVPSYLFSSSGKIEANSVLKVNDSVGCDQVYLLESEQQWCHLSSRLDAEKQYILQPYIIGKNLSLSCLFYRGKAYFICCNEQHVKIHAMQFILIACTVNVQPEKRQQYQLLCQQIAEAIPGLFGFVGIDFIQTETGGDFILEINPRLTTSYAGIKLALGLNIAECVLEMLNGKEPILENTKNKQVYIDINQGVCCVR